MGNSYIKSTIYKRFLHSNQIFKKNEFVNGKSALFVKVHFPLPIQFAYNLLLTGPFFMEMVCFCL